MLYIYTYECDACERVEYDGYFFFFLQMLMVFRCMLNGFEHLSEVNGG